MAGRAVPGPSSTKKISSPFSDVSDRRIRTSPPSSSCRSAGRHRRLPRRCVQAQAPSPGSSTPEDARQDSRPDGHRLQRCARSGTSSRAVEAATPYPRRSTWPYAPPRDHPGQDREDFAPDDYVTRYQAITMACGESTHRPGTAEDPARHLRSTWEPALNAAHGRTRAWPSSTGCWTGLPLAATQPAGAMTRGEIAQLHLEPDAADGVGGF